MCRSWLSTGDPGDFRIFKVPPQSRRDADGGPTARTPQSGQLRSLVDFRQIRRDAVLETAALVSRAL